MTEKKGPRFCYRCGGELSVRRLVDHDRLVCPRCGEIHYQNPVLAAGTVIRLPHDRLVLIRRSIEPGYGQVSIPGGHVELGETVEDGARRETREEVGLEVELDDVLGVFTYATSRVAVVVYLAHPVGGRLLPESPECSEIFTVSRHAVPWGELAFRSSHDALARYTGHA